VWGRRSTDDPVRGFTAPSVTVACEPSIGSPSATTAPRRSAQGSPGRPGRPGWCDLPRRPRSPVHLQGSRSAVRAARDHPVSRRRRIQRGECAGRGVHRHRQARDLRWCRDYSDQASCRREIFRWALRYNTRRRHCYCGHPVPDRLREPARGYPSASRVFQLTTCPDLGVRPEVAGAGVASSDRADAVLAYVRGMDGESAHLVMVRESAETLRSRPTRCGTSRR
jgi:hypothetical protein